MTCRENACEPTLEQKVAFLKRPGTWLPGNGTVLTKETHMSWVFVSGPRVYKLKKPVRLPYLDFSTLARREAACRAELTLNRRLAADVYLDVLPLSVGPAGLALGGAGKVVDWLVVMRRLDEALTLEQSIRDGRLQPRQLDLLAATLARFYRRALRVAVSGAVHVSDWRRRLAYNEQVLLAPVLGMPSETVRRIGAVQRRFLRCWGHALCRQRHVGGLVDGHGDLRPEHIWLDDPVRIIDCLEFNPRLRAVDPVDEIASLDVECARLGAVWAGDYVRRHVMRRLRCRASPALYGFYRCYRAMLRARLAIAHLLEPSPRTPAKWRPLANAYLDLALADALRLERALKMPVDR